MYMYTTLRPCLHVCWFTMVLVNNKYFAIGLYKMLMDGQSRLGYDRVGLHHIISCC